MSLYIYNMHLQFSGDGDSNVFARVCDRVSYGRHVVKIECANHMTRCVNEKLHKLAKNTAFPLKDRKLLTLKSDGLTRLERIVRGVRVTVKNVNALEGVNAVKLREQLINVPYHVFGQHHNCRYNISFTTQ